MNALGMVLMVFVLACALAVAFSRNLLQAIIIFMSQSLVMSVIWILLESPDLAITEAAVGAGIDSLLLFVTLKKIHAIDKGRMVEHDAPVAEDRQRSRRESGLDTADLASTEKEAVQHG